MGLVAPRHAAEARGEAGVIVSHDDPSHMDKLQVRRGQRKTAIANLMHCNVATPIGIAESSHP